MELNDGELKKLRQILGTDKSESVPSKLKDVRIFVLQRGWVVVGATKKEGQEFVLTNAAVIRTWGTTKGLPELVNGPTKSTKLENVAKSLRFHELTVVLSIDCEDSEWSKAL